MVYPELPHDVNSPTHPVSAMDYMPVEPLRALQLHRLQWTVLLVLSTWFRQEIRAHLSEWTDSVVAVQCRQQASPSLQCSVDKCCFAVRLCLRCGGTSR